MISRFTPEAKRFTDELYEQWSHFIKEISMGDYELVKLTASMRHKETKELMTEEWQLYTKDGPVDV